MSGQLVFSEESLINDNVFKFEQRLHSHANKYIEGGAILTTYFSQNGNATTVDRGTRDIDQLFGKQSPLRFNLIKNFPLYGFGQVTPDNTDEMQIEDFNVEGDCVIIPSTIVPNVFDFFTINHMKMKGLFQVTAVNYDSMKVDGFYKIHYRLNSTEDESLQKIMSQVVETYNMDLNAVGSSVNPVVQEDEFIHKKQVEQMVDQMILSYRALFYNDRHNCFLYHHPQMGLDWFDMCGNEFMAKHSIMNTQNSTKVIALHNKIRDPQLPLFYNNSIYNWLELGAPARMLQKFNFILNYAEGYLLSSFARWNDGDIQIMQPLALHQVGINSMDYSFFDNDQLNAFLNPETPPSNEYEKLIWGYIHHGNQLSTKDVSLYTADALISSIRKLDTFLLTPIIIYIIRQILRMN